MKRRRLFGYLVAMLVVSGCGGILAPENLEDRPDQILGAAPGAGVPTCGDRSTAWTARLLDRNFLGFNGVATDGAHVYYTANGLAQVLRVPVEGGAREVVAAGDAQRGVYVMKAHGSRVCWLASGSSSIYCTDGGSAPTVVVDRVKSRGCCAPGWEYDMDFDATHVYWTEPYALMRAPLTGGAHELVANGEPRSIAVGRDRVFWTDHFQVTVHACSKAGCADVVNPEKVAKLGDFPADILGRIAADDAHVYISTHHADAGGNRAGSLVRVPALGGAPQTLAACPGESGVNVAVDRTHAYLLTHANGYTQNGDTPRGSVVAISLSSLASRTIARDQEYPSAVALSGSAIYWTNESQSNGQLMTADK